MSRAFVAGRRTSHSHENSRSVLNPVQRPSCTEKCICLKKLHVALEHPPSRVERHLQVRRGGPRPRPRRLVHRGCKWRPTYNPEPSQVACCQHKAIGLLPTHTILSRTARYLIAIHLPDTSVESHTNNPEPSQVACCQHTPSGLRPTHTHNPEQRAHVLPTLGTALGSVGAKLCHMSLPTSLSIREVRENYATFRHGAHESRPKGHKFHHRIDAGRAGWLAGWLAAPRQLPSSSPAASAKVAKLCNCRQKRSPGSAQEPFLPVRTPADKSVWGINW